MNPISGLKNSIAFLTIIPVGMDPDGFVQAAAYMPLFPIIGAIIGLVAGFATWLIQLILPQLIAAIVGMGLLLLLNGAQHMDGLLDFADGLMYHGSKRGKLRVMQDPTTGAGGVALGSIILLLTVFSIAALPPASIISGLAVAEASAIFGMVLAASAGKSAHKGMNTLFIERMHDRRSLRLGTSCVIALAIASLGFGIFGLIVVIGASFTALVMVAVADRAFGGLTGDVLGATNEIARASVLLLLLVFLKWA